MGDMISVIASLTVAKAWQSPDKEGIASVAALSRNDILRRINVKTHSLEYFHP
jgi:hypothetical protein